MFLISQIIIPEYQCKTPIVRVTPSAEVHTAYSHAPIEKVAECSSFSCEEKLLDCVLIELSRTSGFQMKNKTKQNKQKTAVTMFLNSELSSIYHGSTWRTVIIGFAMTQDDTKYQMTSKQNKDKKIDIVCIHLKFLSSKQKVFIPNK